MAHVAVTLSITSIEIALRFVQLGVKRHQRYVAVGEYFETVSPHLACYNKNFGIHGRV